MIKFFRKIRYNLMETGKTGKYFKYAIGEIILVMIGILLALGINSWNQNRLSKQQELVYLANFKDELTNNISILQQTDSIYAKYEISTSNGIKLFKNNPSIYDFKHIDSLIETRWSTFKVNRSTYTEMLNNGSFYILKNKLLKNQIDNHFIVAQLCESAFKEINSNGQDISYNTDIYPLELLRDRLQQSPVNLKGIDTTWIHNPNSSIYIGFFRKAKFYEQTNGVRRRFIGDFIKSCNDLIEVIDDELKVRAYD